jgi:ABC-2 type transport system permease protein
MIGTIYLKEIKSFFKTPLAYVLAGLFSLITGWIFFNLLVTFVENTQHLPGQFRGQLDFVNHVVIKLFGNVNFLMLFICPILTMRIFSEEKKEGTLDLYFTAPIKDYQLILAKYFAVVTMLLFLLATTAIFPFILWTVKVSDFSFVWSGYLGLILNGLCYCAVGLLASSLTQNQIVAALISFVVIMGLWMISWGIQLTTNYIYVQVLKYITVVNHFEMFVKGNISLSNFAYYFSFILLFLFLTKKVLEARNW